MTETLDKYIRFVIILSKVPGRSFTEELIRAHISFLRDLDKNGRLVLCGPFSDYEGGMVIVQADSLEDAHRMAQSDPFVKSGAETYEIRTWHLSCEENNHMGKG